MRFCPLCSKACLEFHPELIWWRKCPVCGYCEINSDLSEKDAARAKESPHTRYAAEEAIKTIEKIVEDRFIADTTPLKKE